MLIALVVSACAADNSASSDTSTTSTTAFAGATTTTNADIAIGAVPDPDGEWVLESGTIDGETFPLVPDWRITMVLANGTIGGTAACNGYGGTFTFDGATMTVGDLAATEIGCEQPVMESEQAFFQAIQEPMTLELAGDRLTATRDGVDLRFVAVTPAPTAELVGPSWKLQTVLDGEVAIQALGEPTLQLNEDGTFTGSTGCREVSGSYQIFGDELQFPQMSADGECSADLADQDSFVISVLEGSRIEIDGNQLSLFSSGGEGLQYTIAG